MSVLDDAEQMLRDFDKAIADEVEATLDSILTPAKKAAEAVNYTFEPRDLEPELDKQAKGRAMKLSDAILAQHQLVAIVSLNIVPNLLRKIQSKMQSYIESWLARIVELAAGGAWGEIIATVLNLASSVYFLIETAKMQKELEHSIREAGRTLRASMIDGSLAQSADRGRVRIVKSSRHAKRSK